MMTGEQSVDAAELRSLAEQTVRLAAAVVVKSETSQVAQPQVPDR